MAKLFYLKVDHRDCEASVMTSRNVVEDEP